MISSKRDKVPQSEIGRAAGRQHVSQPKTLAERLHWMSENLPGFREELAAVDAAEQRGRARAAKPTVLDARQRDFWPELKSPAMAFYAGTTSTASTRSDIDEASE